MSDKPLPADLELTALDPIFREHPHDCLDRLRTEDPVYLEAALGRLFLPGNPLRKKLETGKCFARYTVIEDSSERTAAYKIFERWLHESTSSYHDFA